MAGPPTLVLLFTTFPVVTETFLQREVEALAEDGARLELWSLWSGQSRFGAIPVRRMGRLGWLSLIVWLPYWLVVRPRALGGILRCFFRRPPNRINFAENLLGLGLGLRWAHAFASRQDRFVLHAVWGSLPATFAWVIARLIGCPFTFAAHAYDLFEDGGDWHLTEKCRTARWIRTSTEAGAERLKQAGATAERVEVIRRGLVQIPALRAAEVRTPAQPLRILSVGRLVPKMGYALQVEVYRELRALNVPFAAEIIGEGPERATIERLLDAHGLSGQVKLRGAQPFSEVEAAIARADVALFTGVVAATGDRAGFPNFLGEAMAGGLPVVATPVGAVEEGVRHGENGLIADTPRSLAQAITDVASDPAVARERAGRARAWVEAEFDARLNMRRLRRRLETIAATR